MLHGTPSYMTYNYGHAMWQCPLPHPYYKEVTTEMRETNKVGHVKHFTNGIEALTQEINTFGFVTPIFVVKSELARIGFV